jgi:hypothetical protein
MRNPPRAQPRIPRRIAARSCGRGYRTGSASPALTTTTGHKRQNQQQSARSADEASHSSREPVHKKSSEVVTLVEIETNPAKSTLE